MIGKFNRGLTEKLPRTLHWTLLHTIGQTNINRISRTWIYCCESRNPFLQILFVALSFSSISGFLYKALPHIPGPYLSNIHYVLIPAQIVSIYASYYVACTSDPGIITPDNLQKHLDYYPYDGLIYKPKKCTTCDLLKPARSKHCSMCKACVGRLDHHCAWVNQCVGENNQRYFFLFLFTLVEFSAYGAYLCFQVYRGFIVEWGLDKAYVHHAKTGQKSLITFPRALLYVLHHDRILGAIGILGAVVSAVVFIFFLYQLYLAARGVTTNEAFKWELVEDSIVRGELYKMVPVKSYSTTLKEKNYVTKRNKKNDQEEAKEKRVESLEEVDNIYDKGIIHNLKEVFFPPRF
ncbi:DHHC palmitoyltransferase-domain-containing protein [Gilbertella persicaria]|uniref:DHHC palmitoyltransferase-domain-containing protein n=1 Tax=Gilbertella persicaria TaxID=101096 RepID=UPI00221F8065|nr:DHHC palmitoyltransferase-domain-containing protein [Gilbertella persicaria]KAI8081988.1 DHHC palmitoyltransferase-domain-containing protein [Gilbertella persicaria]